MHTHLVFFAVQVCVSDAKISLVHSVIYRCFPTNKMATFTHS